MKQTGHAPPRRTRREIAKYVLSVCALLLGAATVQLCVLDKLRILGAIPDLMLVTVLLLAFFWGRFTGAIVGIVAGVFIEALGGSGISLLPVVYFLCGYLVGHYARAVIPRKFSVYLMLLLGALVVRGATTLTYASLTYDQFSLPRVLLGLVLPELLATALWGCLLYLPVRRFCRAVGD